MKRCMLAVVSVIAALLLGYPETLLSQALERTIYVTMVDGAGAPVPNMQPTDFVVREDEVAREILRVVPATDPMDIAILVDNSFAAEPMVPEMRRALPEFLDILMAPTASGQRNQVALITLANRPTILASASTDRVALDKAIDRVWPESFIAGHYLLDGIIETTQGFRKREAARPIIVAIISEGPEFSNRQPDQVLVPLRDYGVALHVISVGRPSVGIDDEFRYRMTVVDQGPRMSGGTHAQLLAPAALGGRLRQLGDVLTHAYKITYGHPDSLIPPRQVTVTARRADRTALATPIRDLQVRR